MTTLTYRTMTAKNRIAVYLDGKRVGEIGACVGGWCYRTRGGVGETFRTVQEVKNSLRAPVNDMESA